MCLYSVMCSEGQCYVYGLFQQFIEYYTEKRLASDC